MHEHFFLGAEFYVFDLSFLNLATKMIKLQIFSSDFVFMLFHGVSSTNLLYDTQEFSQLALKSLCFLLVSANEFLILIFNTTIFEYNFVLFQVKDRLGQVYLGGQLSKGLSLFIIFTP